MGMGMMGGGMGGSLEGIYVICLPAASTSSPDQERWLD